MDPVVKLSELKGIEVYYLDDFHETASLILRLYRTKQEKRGEIGTRRPTIYGVMRAMADIAEPGGGEMELNIIRKEVRKRGFIENATVKDDDDPF